MPPKTTSKSTAKTRGKAVNSKPGGAPKSKKASTKSTTKKTRPKTSTKSAPSSQSSQPQSQSQSQLSQTIFGRQNRLDNIFSSQQPAESDTKAPKDSSNLEEDEGFFYKRTSDNDEKQSRKRQRQVSTPVSKLNDALEGLGEQFDELSSLEFEPEPKQAKTRKEEIGKLSSPIRPRYEGTYYEGYDESSSDDYIEEVSHHKLDLTGGDSDFEEPVKPQMKSDRRSSYHKRGKRILSIGNGLVGIPHDDVTPQDYYKLLDNSLPEPHRMKQLLIWCFHKKIQDNANVKISTPDERTVVNIAKVIQDEVLQDLRDGNINTSWYNQPEVPNVVTASKEIVLPNPLNIAAKENIQKYSKQLAKLRREKEQWKDLYNRNINSLDKKLTKIGDVKVNESLESYCSNKEVDFTPVLSENLINNLDSTCKEISDKFPDNVENSIDKLYNTTNQLIKISQLIEKYTTTKLTPKISEFTKNYIDKSKVGNKSNSDGKTVWPIPPQPLGVKQMLQGIAKLDKP